MVAIILGLIGVILSTTLGREALSMDLGSIALCVGIAILSGLVSLLATLQAERSIWLKLHILTRSLWTWVFFLSWYFGLLLSLAPPLRSGHVFSMLILPLILCGGISIFLFGPMQDWIIRKRAKASLTSGALLTIL